MKEELKRTVLALAKLKQHKAHPAYRALIDLAKEMQQDIRLMNDQEEDTMTIFRNQGGIYWLGSIIKQMEATDREPTKVYDGGYTDI